MATTTSLTCKGAVAWIRLEGADQLNAIGTGTYASLVRHLDEIESDATIRALVVHGAGRGFCAGADIAEIGGFADAVQFEAFIHGLANALDRLAASRLPVIAAIHGAALGGGLELAMACDIRVATTGSRLGLPEAKLGVLPGAGGTQRLPRLVPHGVVAEMLMLGRLLDAERAHQLGLVNRLAAEDALLTDVAALAGELADGAPLAHAATKELLLSTAPTSLADGIVAERRATTALFASADGREGFAAFLARRRPNFTGQ
ncbi:enoyl-CoA hydratase-related protein [Sporichthya sp.]|uniref:enoyl-CoA hydratase/isomerase family protein n=1 Tax=Sporichthya sp. TaxID=65475 RepID=UPI0017F9F510|nr:enoyl-CoA hydratase-related protein [Sporichthya sp.]MBA3744114.1 enoyl-CoA hydratase/isomerase family protein [Sporichthya sp.]